MSGTENSALLSAIPWAVAAVGWGFTHVFSEARERRKEVRAQLDKAQERLLSLEKLAREFHAANTYDADKAAEIRLGVQILERKFHRISCLHVDSLVAYIIALRRAITLTNFDSSEFATQSPTSDILADISSTVLNLDDALEMQYIDAYPPSFPYFRFRRKK